MKTNITLIIKGMILLALFNSVHAQEKPAPKPINYGKDIENMAAHQCATVAYESYIKKKYPAYSSQKFEAKVSAKVAATIKRLEARNNNSIITIPVVVHVVHNNEELGTGANITDAQIMSQITVLNQDYRRMAGTPGYNENPVGADVEIEFCMAQTNPSGGSTNGIDRISIDQESWGIDALEDDLKAVYNWDTSKYLNLYVCRFGGDLVGVGGYGFPPSDSGVEGLEDFDEEGIPAEFDGVAVDYHFFGSADLYPEGTFYPPYDKGRILTHEVGHFFGLRHIWGDGNCSATDYCDDTPAAAHQNTTCTPVDSCPNSDGMDMIENYMDYTPQACMNVFTQDQKIRMYTVIENSALRSSQVNSQACLEPELGLGSNQRNNFTIYPNPAKDILNITSANGLRDAAYTIYNTLGQKIKSGILHSDNEISIQIDGLTQGIYSITIIGGDAVATQKFIKE